MPDSDNDKSLTDQTADDAAASTPTPVVKLGDAPEPKGGDADSPTKAFAVPAEAATSDAGTEAEESDAESQTPEANDSTTGSVESSADVTDTVQISKSDVAEAAAAVDDDADKTTQFAVPPKAAPAQPTAPAAAPQQAAPAQQPAPQVIPPAAAAPAEKKGKGKLIGIVVAALVVIAAIAVGIWYMTIGTSPETKVADAAKDYQQAMNDGDLVKLRDITCGDENTTYTSMDEAEFKKAYAAQKANNELMQFDDVNAVSINGDTAKVGVDMYPSGDPSKKAPVQITLHKVGDDWKVCKDLK
ncbi:hypothetical protein nbrc107696_04840 [Gordonia spumicola]|uniref:DUF4878 domain-containing protein n=1 Tax=Gordonia spumicola TaxID=589161 RepID=A0A7I9V3M9_9ACTN|nr:hypothetical protein [Gordonia spumicola]GEE00038.1 hypothetical protein nbrc107696_04840 [Gordonia spumicola]